MKFIGGTTREKILAGETPQWILRHSRRERLILNALATPPWVKARDFRHLRERAIRLTMLHGELYVLDHIVPLVHPYVCGLNVPENIAVIPHRVNANKSNKWFPDQGEFDLQLGPPIQLEL